MSEWAAPDQPGREEPAPPPMRITLPPHIPPVPPPSSWSGGTVRPPGGLIPSGPPRPVYREPLPARLGPAAAGAASAALWMLLFGLLATTARSYAWLTFGAGAAVALLFVESDDAYLAILRLDDGEDLRVFGSDAAFAEESRLGALLLGDIETPVPDINDVVTGPDDTEEDTVKAPADPDVEPVGDADLLADLGIPAGRLLQLCAREGMLPADVTAEVCQALGA